MLSTGMDGARGAPTAGVYRLRALGARMAAEWCRATFHAMLLMLLLSPCESNVKLHRNKCSIWDEISNRHMIDKSHGKVNFQAARELGQLRWNAMA
jgi:hypothetical protein